MQQVMDYPPSPGNAAYSALVDAMTKAMPSTLYQPGYDIRVNIPYLVTVYQSA